MDGCSLKVRPMTKGLRGGERDGGWVVRRLRNYKWMNKRFTFLSGWSTQSEAACLELNGGRV